MSWYTSLAWWDSNSEQKRPVGILKYTQADFFFYTPMCSKFVNLEISLWESHLKGCFDRE
jgi:hypothetical protein